MDKPSFDTLVELFERDPDAFDKLRRELLEHAISDARPELQGRLRGLQFQIDGIRRTAKNPLDCSVRIQRQVFKKLDELRYELIRDNRFPRTLRQCQNNIVRFESKVESN